jgi:hypothetical protein
VEGKVRGAGDGVWTPVANDISNYGYVMKPPLNFLKDRGRDLLCWGRMEIQGVVLREGTEGSPPPQPCGMHLLYLAVPELSLLL